MLSVWVGKPFVDLQKGWKYVLDKYLEIDPDRRSCGRGGRQLGWLCHQVSRTRHISKAWAMWLVFVITTSFLIFTYDLS
jgi:hypothetical protein